jgi:hypothetical protein
MKAIQQADTAYSMRRRLNPHHPPEQMRDEAIAFRTSQWAKWSDLKDLYAENRDEMSNTLENKSFIECKSIFEKIFTVELDDALRSTLEK